MMKKYRRISCGFMSSGKITGLDEDGVVSENLNKKLQVFLKEEKVKNYRVINVETVIVPENQFTPNYNLVCLHVEYEV